jgi:hypothetical protein
LGSVAESNRTVNIVSGHTAWAAGLIGAVLQGVPGVRLATCAKKDPNSATTGTALNLNENTARWIEFREGSIPPMKDPKLLSLISDPEHSYSFNARDALDALDSGWADVAAVPVGLVQRQPSYVRLARLVASESSCVLVCGERFGRRLLGHGRDQKAWKSVVAVWPKLPDKTWDFTTHTVANKMVGKDAVRIGAEHATIGQLQVSEICQFLGQEGITARDVLVEIDSRKAFDATLKSLDDLRLSSGAPRLDAVVLWEPHATWLMRTLGANDKARPHAYISLRRSPDGKHHRTPMFEFDLVIRADKRTDANIIRRVKDLLLRVATVSEDLPQFRDDAPSRFAEPLAHYFGIGQSIIPSEAAEERMRVIGPVGYDVSIPTNAMHIFLETLKGARW